MKFVTFAFALFGSIAGLWAAWLWLRASKVEIATGSLSLRPGDYVRAGTDLPGSGPPEAAFRDAIAGVNEDLMAALYSLHQSSYLNKRAAVWTAASVAASGLSAVIASLG